MTGAKKTLNKAMNKEARIRESLLIQAAEVISRLTGLYFPKVRRKDLERNLRSAAPEFGFEDPEDFCRWLTYSNLTKSQIEVLAGHLTVGETYFFRDKKYFDFLEERVLPELIQSRRSAGKYLRIWSAGCCTGEEPYSIAILLNKMIGNAADWNITILASDINPAFLRKASPGIYGEWSFRDTPLWVREGYFTKTKENRFELLPKIRKRVSFIHHNLVDNAYPSPLNNTNAMDLILCRNVLMYLTPEHQTQVIRKLHQCLVEGGWLVVGPSEITNSLSKEFLNVRFQGGTLYRKQGAGERMIENLPLSVPKTDPWSTINQKSSVDGGGSTEIQKPGPVADVQPSRDHHPSLILLARSAADTGRLPEALDHCEKAIAADRCNPDYYYLRASILQEQGRLFEAVADLRKALYLDQDLIPAHILLGNLAFRQGRRRESSRHFRNALTLLNHLPPEEVVPGAEGLTAGRLIDIIRTTIGN